MARAAISKIEGIETVSVDTTARAFLRSARKGKGLKVDVAAALKKKKLKLAKFAASKTRKPVEVFQIEVKGLG
ncbi:MAG: hypothetical protein VX951_03220 [Planctomycetota bacterium]|nr:hypothetical protein [Planctomycetota bacterium]